MENIYPMNLSELQAPMVTTDNIDPETWASFKHPRKPKFPIKPYI